MLMNSLPQTQAADPKKEYVSGGSLFWMQPGAQTLPWAIDDVTADFGDDLYEKMEVDPQVNKGITILKLAALAQGIHITPNRQRGEDFYKEAMELSDFCRRILGDLEAPYEYNSSIPLYGQIWDILSGVMHGNRIAEQIYTVPKSGSLANKLVLKELKVKSRHSVAYVVDRYFNVLGLMALNQHGQASPGSPTAGVITPGVMGSSKLLPRRKFAIYSFRPKNSDPRGTSIARCVYNPWFLKLQTWPAYLKYLAQFASPSLVGITPPNAGMSPVFDANGQPVMGPNGQQLMIPAEHALLQSLLNFQNGTALALPNGASITTIESKQSGSPFNTAIGLFNAEIIGGITGQSLATEEGDHQSRAASEVHQDGLGLVVLNIKDFLAAMLRSDVLMNLIEWNYGPKYLELLPRVSLSYTAQQDFTSTANSVATLVQSRFLDSSQYPFVDSMLGLPPRTNPPGQDPANPDPNAPGGEGGEDGGGGEGGDDADLDAQLEQILGGA